MKIILFLTLFLGHLYAAEEDDKGWFLDAQFQKELDEKTQSRARSGNRLKLLINGMESIEKRMANLERADVVFIKTYEFWNDHSGQLILKKLIERAKQGAKVFIQFDAKGTLAPIKSGAIKEMREGTLSPIPDYLQQFLDQSDGNGFLIPTSVPHSYLTSFPTFHAHEKYFVTWENKNQVGPVTAILGGMNLGDMYLAGGVKDQNGEYRTVSFYESEGFNGTNILPMRDTDLEIIGPVTQDIVSRFIAAAEYELQNTNPVYQQKLVPDIRSALAEMKSIREAMLRERVEAYPQNAGEAFVRLISKNSGMYGYIQQSHILNFFTLILRQVPEHKRVRIATGFFAPTKILWKAVNSAIQRGVSFDILSNMEGGPEEFIKFDTWGSRGDVRFFMKHSPPGMIHFYGWLGDPLSGVGSLMHQKVYSFGDGKNDPCAIGSANWNAMSMSLDSEDLLVIQDPLFKGRLDEMLNRDFRSPYSREITLKEMERESLLERIKEFIIHKFFRDIL